MSMNAPERLRCEYFENPLGLDEPRPRLSWWVNDDRRGARQSACHVLVASSEDKLARDEGDVWDSGKVETDQSVHVAYDGAATEPQTRYFWKVRTWDADGAASPWSVPAFWETGLRDREAWKGKWIGADIVGGPRTMAPSPYLRKVFDTGKPIRAARLYITALGLYEAHVNGQPVTTDAFRPGWTDYRKRVQYQTYDVTDLLRQGDNTVGVILGDGWYCGHVAWTERQRCGDRPKLLAQLRVDFQDGESTVIATDETWRCSAGPILAGDLLMGEEYDARLEMQGWAATGFDDSAWRGVLVFDDPGIDINASASPPVRPVKELTPVDVRHIGRSRAGAAYIVDLGQNMVGVIRLKVKGPAGRTIRLRYAEMLDDNGQLYTANLRGARATDYYTLKGDGEEVYQPRFTFHGFRYVELTGMEDEPDAGTLTGIVLQSDTPETGSFECSDDLVNRLQRNIQWGQRGNFLEVPTDCPQRDERLGWTGDAQVFVRTACFNMDVAGFFAKWAADLEDSQGDDGRIPQVAPNVGYTNNDGGPAWAEAHVICPWTMYQCFGDTRILERHYDSMARFVDYLKQTSRGYIRCYDGYEGWHGYGDWLAIDAPDTAPDKGPTPKTLIGTAYYARAVEIMAAAARVLGRDEDVARYERHHAAVVDAFQREFITPDTMVVGHTQTGYLLALGFDLVPEEKRAAALERLVGRFAERGWRLSTGFVGAVMIAPVLSRMGRTDLAYRVFMRHDYPGWLYSVLQGATTMWERWNSYTKDRGFGHVGMNSFNHYAYGAIGEWLYATVAGLDTDTDDVGFKRLVIAPEPGGGLTHASASLDSPYGPASSAWRLDGDRFTLEITVPANTTAAVTVPAAGDVTEGGEALTKRDGVSNVQPGGRRVTFDVDAGQYRFESMLPADHHALSEQA